MKTDRTIALHFHCLQFCRQTFSSNNKSDMSSCAVLSCGNYFSKTKDVSYHRFSRDGEISAKWRSFCGMQLSEVITNQTTCSINFDKSCFVEMFKYLNGQKDIPRLVFDGKLTRN